MTYRAEKAAIEGRFKAVWDVSHAGMVVNYSNTGTTPPDKVAGAQWARVRILNGQAAQASLGLTGFDRMPGVISMDFFGPLGDGAGGLIGLADEAAAIFRRWQGSGITAGAASVRDLGETRELASGLGPPVDGSWYMVNVSIPFYRDEQF